ncbi:MAG: neutral zinc metallopeptidase, partial [Gemmatimonadota bacterium]
MRWKRGSRSSNLEDRRGARLRRVPLTGRGGISLGAVLIVVVLSLLFRQDLSSMLGLVAGDMGTSMETSVQS